MSRLSGFNSPLLLGFDHFDRLLDRISKTSPEGYPPYNIEQMSENGLRITLAVAGFSWDDLSVALEDNQLVIRGRQPEDEGHRIFIHRGIASRQFQRAYLLADGMEVVGAALDNGLLHIDLVRRVPEPKVRTIPIGRGAEAPHTISLSPGHLSPGEVPPGQSRARSGPKREV